MRRLAFLVAPALAITALSGAALAHTKLLSSTPAPNTTVTRPTKLTLTFSEVLVGPLSGIELVMTGMPGMASHAPMPIKGFKTATAGKVLIVTLPRALPAGTYDLKWHAVASDQHRVESQYTFTVR